MYAKEISIIEAKHFKFPKVACDYISVVDTNEDLVSLHYNEDAESMWKLLQSKKSYPFGEIRGLVIDKKQNKIIMKSFPNTKNVIIENNYDSLDQFKYFSQRYEGTIIRVRYYNQKWLISTHRKIDCSKSKFGSQTFKQMFEDACKFMDFDYTTLDQNLCYVFLLVHPNNQITNQYTVENPHLYHLDTLSDSHYYLFGLKNLKSIYKNSTIKIPKPQILNKTQAIDLLKQGYGVVSLGFQNKTNFIPSSLNTLIEIRGNECNIFKRWCQLKQQNRENDIFKVIKHTTDFQSLLNQQIELTIPIILNCCKHINDPSNPQFQLYNKTKKLQKFNGYKPTHYNIAKSVILLTLDEQEMQKLIRNKINSLKANDLYQTCVSHTNSHINSELFFKNKNQ
jgi:hypothetical protein